MAKDIIKKITAATWRDVKNKPSHLADDTGIPSSGINSTAADGSITYTEQTNTPTDPVVSAAVQIYVRDDKLILAYDDAGTMRYKYLDMTGTGVTWVHTTTAP